MWFLKAGNRLAYLQFGESTFQPTYLSRYYSPIPVIVEYGTVLVEVFNQLCSNNSFRDVLVLFAALAIVRLLD